MNHRLGKASVTDGMSDVMVNVITGKPLRKRKSVP